MKDKWVVAVISTYYDLVEERKAICDFIKDHGMICSAFEEPDFPVLPDTQSHVNCIKALERVDLAVVLINKRYGGEYYLNKSFSITESEYNAINTPKIVFVNKKTWDERHDYNQRLEQSVLPQEEFDKQYNPSYVKDVNVFHFINRIQNDYDRTHRSNWILFWDDLDDLLSKIAKTFQSQTVSVLQSIKKKQIEEVKSRKTSTGLSLSLGEVIDRHYYIEQEYTEDSGGSHNYPVLSDLINDKLNQSFSCRVLGEAGIGKTTLITNAFLKQTQRESNTPYPLSFFVWLKDFNSFETFSFADYFCYCCEKYLHKEKYPFFSFEGYRFIFYLDGFDEMSENFSNNELNSLMLSEMFSCPLVLTSRTQYAERYMASNDFSSRFTYTFRLKDWSEETARKYIKQFCSISGADNQFEERINCLLTDNQDLHDALKTPLLITVLLYIVKNSRMQIPETIKSRTTLFFKCFEIYAKREIETKIGSGAHIPSVEDIILFWSLFAWVIYESRLKGNRGVKISDAISFIDSYSGKPSCAQIPLPIYDSIFDTNDDYAFGAFHEHFLEFLVANALVDASCRLQEPFPTFLKYVFRPEINRYYRNIVEQKESNIRSTIVKNIQKQYFSHVHSLDQQDIAIRVHSVYHLSRLDFHNNHLFLQRLMTTEQNIAVLQSLYFGVIKMGLMQHEKTFYNLLTSDSLYMTANLGYHLAYYDNLQGQTELPYHDDTSCQWGGTLHAIQRHFMSTDKKHYWLRRIELVTIQHFISNRKSTFPLTEEILSKIEDAVFHPYQVYDHHFQYLVEKEFFSLRKQICSINHSFLSFFSFWFVRYFFSFFSNLCKRSK